MQVDQQDQPWVSEEDQGEGSQLHADGECSGLPGGNQKVRGARHGDFPDCRPI